LKTPPEKVQFVDNRVRFIYLNFLICVKTTSYNSEFKKITEP